MIYHWTVAADRGYHVVKIECFRTPGDKAYETNIALREYEAGRWFVAGHERLRYPLSKAVRERLGLAAAEAEGEPRVEHRVRVTKVEFDIEVADETFVLEFPVGTRVWDDAIGDWVIQEGSLLNKPLGDLSEFGFDPTPLEGKRVLVCFFDMSQRPSRNGLAELTGRSVDLAKQGVAVVAVHASLVEEDALREWLETSRIALPVGKAEKGQEYLRSAWAVRSLPWLLLTDRQHIVRAEGFAASELDAKITQAEQ
ncbi:MAG: hypothetical protein JW993_07905 [Sedimentisphaerales bacterium]|nr:hypothetical protein [Sedimentisphaerales bacterium]